MKFLFKFIFLGITLISFNQVNAQEFLTQVDKEKIKEVFNQNKVDKETIDNAFKSLCDCSDQGNCSCGDGCVCPNCKPMTYAEGLKVALKEDKNLIVHISYFRKRLVKDFPKAVHCFIDKLPETNPGSIVLSVPYQKDRMIWLKALDEPTIEEIKNEFKIGYQEPKINTISFTPNYLPAPNYLPNENYFSASNCRT